MNIIGGTLKGKRLSFEKGSLSVRPAMARMRKSAFDILGKNLVGKSFLDLFGGTGSIALEAASRGASRVVLCEKDKEKAATLIANAKLAEAQGISVQCHFIAAELFLLRNKESFDFAFFDPPFSYRFKNDLLELAVKHSLLNKDGILLFHLPKKEALSLANPMLSCFDSRHFGNSTLLFFKLKSDKNME